MATTKVLDQPRPTALVMAHRELLQLLGVGLLIGLVTYALYVMLDRYVFEPTLCKEGSALAMRCESKEYFASTLAMILGAMGALFALVQQRVYRPLLVVILSTVALWGVVMTQATLPWWALTAMIAVVFALTYAAFAWLVQLRNLYLAIGCSLVLLVVLRLIITA